MQKMLAAMFARRLRESRTKTLFASVMNPSQQLRQSLSDLLKRPGDAVVAKCVADTETFETGS